MKKALNSIGTPAIASPQSAAILSSIPAVATVVRDEAQRLVVCNAAYEEAMGRPADNMLGSTHSVQGSAAYVIERHELMRAVINDGAARDFLQFWSGQAWLTRIIPLDHVAFGFRGTLSVNMQAPVGTALTQGDTPHVLRTANFGALSRLTPAEKRTIFDLAKGRSNNEIAERQERSVRTVECHVRAIHEKLGTSSRSAIIRDASERGIQLFTQTQWETMINGGTISHRPKARPGATQPTTEIEPKDSPQTA